MNYMKSVHQPNYRGWQGSKIGKFVLIGGVIAVRHFPKIKGYCRGTRIVLHSLSVDQNLSPISAKFILNSCDQLAHHNSTRFV